MVDPQKMVDKVKAISGHTEVILSYTSNEKASVKVFLCKAGPNLGRVSTADLDNIANMKELKDAYK